jgi:hypothetical protein
LFLPCCVCLLFSACACPTCICLLVMSLLLRPAWYVHSASTTNLTLCHSTSLPLPIVLFPYPSSSACTFLYHQSFSLSSFYLVLPSPCHYI